MAFCLVSLIHLLLVDPTVGSPPVSGDPLWDLHFVDLFGEFDSPPLDRSDSGISSLFVFHCFCPRNLVVG